MPLLCLTVIALCAVTAVAQNAKESCGAVKVIALTGENPRAKIIAEPALGERLASRGLAIIRSRRASLT